MKTKYKQMFCFKEAKVTAYVRTNSEPVSTILFLQQG